MRRSALIAWLAAFAAAPLTCAQAQTSEGGRYSLSQNGEQYIRLDSRTGAISRCSNRNGLGWACTTLPDERSALDGEIGRLEAENARLKSELMKRETTGTVAPSVRAAPPARSDPQNEARHDVGAKTEPKAEPKTEKNESTNQSGSAAAAPTKTPDIEAPAKMEERSASAAPSVDQGKVERQLPGSSESERKDGFLSRAWQQLIDLARMVSRG